MPDRNPLLAPLLSPPPTTPSDPVLVLKTPPFTDPTEIAQKVLNRERIVNQFLLHDKLLNPPASGPRVIHNTHIS